MIDLTNKTIDEINNTLQKYAYILEEIRYKDKLPQYSIIIDIAMNHIKSNYLELPKDIRAWSVFIVYKLFNEIKHESDVLKIIDDFISYYNKEYNKYICDIVLFVSEEDRDCGFINNYLEKKIGK